METRKSSQKRLVLLILMASCLAGSVEVSLAQEQGPVPPPLTKLGKKLERKPEHLKEPMATAILESWWPGYPEWLATFSEIMAGNTITPARGWYRKAIGQSYFDWKATRSRYDVNGDRRISREEIALVNEDFDQVDLNHDGFLSSIDLTVIAERKFLSQMGSQFSIDTFGYIDRDRDGYVSPAELGKMFYQQDNNIAFDQIFASVRDELAFRSQNLHKAISLNDFQIAFELAARRGTLPSRPLGDYVAIKTSPNVLMGRFIKQEMGFWGAGPSLGDRAPEFRLQYWDRTGEVALSDLIGDQPVVLIFGNSTCTGFRRSAGSLQTLWNRYKNRAKFLMISTCKFQSEDLKQLGVSSKSSHPRDLDSRASDARSCRILMDIEMPTVIDKADDYASRLYSGLPSRMYLIDKQGRIAYKGGRAPFGFRPFELEQALVLLLKSESSLEAKAPQTFRPR